EAAEAAVAAQQREPFFRSAPPLVRSERLVFRCVRRELRRRTLRRLAVPGAGILAGVTSVDPVSEPRGQARRDGALVLDGPVADALSGIKFSRCDEGVGGAGGEAGRAASAEVCGRLGRLTERGRVHIQKEAGDEKP